MGAGLVDAMHGAYPARSFGMLPAGASAEAIAKVRKVYPNQYADSIGDLYFSRLANQVNTAYECAYGYWFPTNLRSALLAVFLRGPIKEILETLTA